MGRVQNRADRGGIEDNPEPRAGISVGTVLEHRQRGDVGMQPDVVVRGLGIVLYIDHRPVGRSDPTLLLEGGIAQHDVAGGGID